jgi:FixJ family two-component response regulator
MVHRPREGITDLVRSMGFDAQAFERAEDFLKSAYLDRTDSLITDVRLPGLSGFELHSRLAASGVSIPKIVITAFPLDADRRRAEQSGICFYLAKPWDEQRLLECIRAAVAGCGRE